MRILNNYYFETSDIAPFCVKEDSSKESLRATMRECGVNTLAVVGENFLYRGLIGRSGLDADYSGEWGRYKTDGFVLHGNTDIPESDLTFIPRLNYSGHIKSVLHRPLDLGKEKAPPCATIIGVGYVGLTLAVALGSRGMRVNGVDTDEELIKLLRSGESHVHELGMNEALSVARPNLKYFHGSSESRSPVVIVTVGTPLVQGTTEPNMAYLEEAFKAAIDGVDSGGLIILRSTVPIGTTRLLCEKYQSVLKSREIDVGFCPERTIEGNAIAELTTNPQVIGVESASALRKAYCLFGNFTRYAIVYTKYEQAELAKLMDNVFRDAFFGVTNLFSRLARKHGVSGTEFLENQKAHYPRNQFGIPSLGVGGPCLTKDYYLLKPSILGDAAEYHLSIGRSEHKKAFEWILDEINKHSREFRYVNIVVMGLAFKGFPETQDIRNSPAIELLEVLVDRRSDDYAIYYYDTYVKNHSCSRATRLENLDNLVGNTIFVLMNNSEHLIRSGVQEFALKGDFAALIIDSFALFRQNGVVFSGKHVVYKTS